MRYFSRHTQAAVAAKDWKKHYFINKSTSQESNNDSYWYLGSIIDAEKVYNQLIALGANPDPDEVDKIIGNSSWTTPSCSECKNGCRSGFFLNEEEETCVLCSTCLTNAKIIMDHNDLSSGASACQKSNA